MPTVVTESDLHADSFLSTCVPYMLGCMLLEMLVSHIRGKKFYRANDTINSMSHGIVEQLLFSLTSKGAEFSVYIHIWNNWSLLPAWDNSALMWILCFLGVDLGYYWFHRMAHEVNLFWATHHVHHSSEDMNLSTALRQGFLQVYFSWIFYVPLAFFISPPLFYLHKQFNTLFQFWIHTRWIKNLGPLELVLNTPSHHRVHHGRNRRYIDKNYGGILIIWDRLFGTFEPESEPVAYGLVHSLSTWDVIYGQVCHLMYMASRIRDESGFFNKLAVIWKGPGWVAGKGRLGDINDIPDVDWSRPKYDRRVPAYLNGYVVMHFCIIVTISFFLLTQRFHSNVLHVLVSGFVLLSLTSFAAIYDRKPYAAALELSRILLFLIAELVCFLIYSDEFVFLWYKDTAADNLIPLIHRPVRILRAVFLLSGIWVVGRAVLFTSFYDEKGADSAETGTTGAIRSSALSEPISPLGPHALVETIKSRAEDNRKKE